MAGKTLIGGTAYEIKGGKTLVNGTGYSIKSGKTLVSGTAYSISFSPPVLYLYNKGDECTAVSGGWKSSAYRTSTNYTAFAPSVQRLDSSLYINNSFTSNSQGVLEVTNKIDLTGKERINFSFPSITSSGLATGQYFYIIPMVFTVNNLVSMIARNDYVLNTNKTVENVSVSLDVSSINGLNRIGVLVMYFANVKTNRTSISFNIDKVWIE